MSDPSLAAPIQGISAALLVLVSVGLLVTAVAQLATVVAARSPVASAVWSRVRDFGPGESGSDRSELPSSVRDAFRGTMGVRATSFGEHDLYRAASATTALLLSLSVLGTGAALVTEPAYYGFVAAGLLVTVGLRSRVRTAAGDGAWPPGHPTQ